MDVNTEFEIKAEAFRIMTGHMAPGKSASMHSQPASYEERYAAWEKWTAEHSEIVSAMLRSVVRNLDV